MFIRDTIKKWRSPALRLCETVVGLVLKHLDGLVTKHFEKIGNGHLANRLQ